MIDIDGKEERKDWEIRFLARLKADGIQSVEAKSVFMQKIAIKALEGK